MADKYSNVIDPIALAARAALERNARINENVDRQVEALRRAEEAERARRLAPTEIGPTDYSLNWEPVEYKEPNVLMNPDSWLNRGLDNLVDAGSNVVFGKPSDVLAVDLGAANIPGVGPAAILAAGGTPGMLDVAGAGGVRRGILKGTDAARHVLEGIFGVRGRNGIQAELAKTIIENTGARTQDEVYAETRKLLDEFGISLPVISYVKSEPSLSGVYNMVKKQAPVEDARVWNEAQRAVREMEGEEALAAMREAESAKQSEPSKIVSALTGQAETPEERKARLRAMVERAKQTGASVKKKREAANAAVKKYNEKVKAAKAEEQRIAEQAAREQAARAYAEAAAARKAEEATARAVRKAAAAEKAPGTGVPNDWRGNRWSSLNHPLGENNPRNIGDKQLSYEDILGPAASEEEKRKAYVLDSTMAAIARGIAPTGPAPKNISFNTFKHTKTNYDQQWDELLDKIIPANIESGNMPGYGGRIVSETVTKNGKKYEVPVVINEDGTREYLYDKMFRPKAQAVIQRLFDRR